METAEEELTKDFFHSVITSSIEAKVKMIPDSIDREQYLSMKECKSCSKAFSKHTSKKYYCHFCYQAFCSECCVLTSHHPETEKSERICNLCYLIYTKINVLEESEKYIQVKLEKEITERKKMQNEIDKIKENTIKLRESMKAQDEFFKHEVEKIDKEIREEQAKVKSLELSTLQIKSKIGTKGNPSGQVVATTNGGRSCMECEIF